jgi:hypothetical protein
MDAAATHHLFGRAGRRPIFRLGSEPSSDKFPRSFRIGPERARETIIRLHAYREKGEQKYVQSRYGHVEVKPKTEGAAPASGSPPAHALIPGMMREQINPICHD